MQAAIKELNQVMPNLMAMENQSVLWLQPDLAGWLEKRGGHFQSWKRRFFLLQGAFLFYFASDFNVESAAPLGVVPVEGSKVVPVTDEKTAGNHKYCFCVALASSVASISKRSEYVLAAPSKQALDEWLKKLQNSAESRKALYAELRRVRQRGGELRAALASSPASAQLLASAPGQDAANMRQEIANATQQIEAMKPEMARLENEAMAQDSARTRALVHFDLLSRNLAGANGSNATYVIGKLKAEADVVQELHEHLLNKVNFMQGLGVDGLDGPSRAALRSFVEESLGAIQDRQGRVRAKAPRYTPLFAGEDPGQDAEWQIDGMAEKKQGGMLRGAINKLKGQADSVRGFAKGTVKDMKTQGLAAATINVGRGIIDAGRGGGGNRGSNVFGAGPSNFGAPQRQGGGYGQNYGAYAQGGASAAGASSYGQAPAPAQDPNAYEQDPNAAAQVQEDPQAAAYAQQGYAAPQQAYDPQAGYGAPQQQQQGYGPPQQQGYGPPQQQGYGPPQQQGYGPPQQQGYGPPQQAYGPPQQQQYNPQQQQGYGPQPQQPGYGPPQGGYQGY